MLNFPLTFSDLSSTDRKLLLGSHYIKSSDRPYSTSTFFSNASENSSKKSLEPSVAANNKSKKPTKGASDLLSQLMEASIELSTTENKTSSKNENTVNQETNVKALNQESFIVGLQSVVDSLIIWASDNYRELGDGFQELDQMSDISPLKTRTQKNKKDQGTRVKSRAEVFTPAWMCNFQNNLIDDAAVGKNSFNTTSRDNREWKATPKVEFVGEGNWKSYVLEPRIEICCGEGPYLFSGYNAASGEAISIRDEDGFWNRVGILDRKLRVVSENVASLNDWVDWGKIALQNTFGFEWQGDNLALARLNMINCFFEYFIEYNNTLSENSKLSNDDLNSTIEDLLPKICVIASWQLWQMDGIRMVTPDSCSSECSQCLKKKSARVGHDGHLPVLKWGPEEIIVPFEAFCYNLNQ